MFKRVMALFTSVALVVSGLQITIKDVDAAVHSSGGSGSWKLVWSDEFNQNVGSSPTGDYWQFDIGNGSSGWGNHEIQNYTNSTSNVAIDNVNGAVDGKALRITAKRENGQITSGRIKSLDRQYVKYGKIEARIKMSNGMQPGVWPAFWMMGNDIHTNGMGWPLCGEIDILEHRNQEREIISTLHWNVGNSYNHGWYGSELNGQYGWVNSIDDWHTYAVEWYEDCMKFFLDGNCYETITLTADMAEEFHKPHFILLNLAIGGPNTPFTKYTTVTGDWQTSSMYVDYVRVYQGNDGNFFRAKSSNTSNIQTTASPMAGMTACALDDWRGAGSVWDYNLGSWAGASGYYAGGSQNDFTLYMSTASAYEWGCMIRARQGVTPGHTYNYTINYNSTSAGSALVKEDVGQTGDQVVGIVSGNGTINGSFTAGAGQNEAQILMDLRGFAAGTKLKITGLSLVDTTPAQNPTTTTAAENNDEVGELIDWSGVGYAGDGAGGGAYTNKYKFYCENSGVSLVNIQESFGTEAGLYVTFPAAVSSTSLSGYAIQGAGALLYLSSFKAKETKFTVTDGNSTYTCYVYYADGTGTEVDTEVTTTKPAETVAPGGNNPSGFTKAPVGEWTLAGNWGCYFGDWNGTSSGSYQLVSDKNYKVYVDTANTGADWLIQARYDAPAITGHKYKVTATVTSDKDGSIGIKEDLSNADIDQVYTNLSAGVATTLTGEYTVTQDAIRVMFELGRGIAAGTTVTFNNIVIEDLTAAEENTTEAPTVAPEKPTASNYVRTVYIDTYGGAITKDEKIDCGIVIMDKVGGDSYEDTVVYDTIDSTGTIKIRGNSTSNADKKPYNISFESKTEVFGMGKAKKWSLLANAFDKSLIRNRLAMEFATDLGLAYTSESTYVDLYVNGVYYGNYLLIESVEAGSDRVDIDTDNESDALVEREADRYEEDVVYFTTDRYGIRFAMGEPEEIDTTSTHFIGVLNKFNGFETALATGDYNAVAEYIDMDSFVNFYIVNELFKNIDFNFSSTRFYIKNGKIYAGPLWDLDLSSGNALSSYYPDYYPNGDSTKGLWCQSFTWFRVLMEIPEFKNKVKERFTEVQPLINHIISGNTGNSINALTSTYATAFAKNYTAKSAGGAGWTVSNADGGDYYSKASEANWATYDVAVEYLRDWLTGRNAYLLSEFSKESLGSVTGDSTTIGGFKYDNLVKKNGVSVSSSTNESNELLPGLTIDGDEGTRWASAHADNQTLIVDLGAEYDIKGMSILWEAASAATYAIKTSTDGVNYKEVATYSSTEGARKDEIILEDEVTARYIMIDCYTRTTQYGFSIYELAVWGTSVSAVKVSDDIEINGLQISTTVEGFRTVYSIDSTVEGQSVSEVGLIYGIDMDGFAKNDMVVGSDNQYVYQSAGTESIGRMDKAFSKNASYAMTMTFGGNSADTFTKTYYVRAYAKLADGSVVYTNIETFTIFEVADVLYRNVKMNTASGHDYLYDKILSKVDSNYKKVDYAWGNILAPATF